MRRAVVALVRTVLHLPQPVRSSGYVDHSPETCLNDTSERVYSNQDRGEVPTVEFAMNMVRLLSLLLFTFGLFTFGGLFVLWFRDVVRRQAGRGTGSAAIRSGHPVEGAFSFVTFVWFALLLLLTLSSLSPDLALDPIQDAIFAIAFLFPPLMLHFFSCAAECSMPASSRVAVEGQRVDSEGLGAARAARRTGWTVSFWALYALGPAMSLVVIAIG